MKTLQSIIFRAACSIIIGALLIKFPDDTAVWITIVIGCLFLLSGVIAIVTYMSIKKRGQGTTVFDSNGRVISDGRPTFPIAGTGSAVLGLILIISPGTVISAMSYIIGAILILGAANQMLNIVTAGRLGRITPVLWICPSIVMIVGLIAIIRPMWIASAPFIIMGWCLLLYGVTEIVNELKISSHRKRIEREMGKAL